MSQWPNKYVIGLTGNIAVGKSVVRQMLQHSGAYTIDADALSHQAMMPGAPAYKPVVNTFGQMILGSDGRINRKMLGQIVFSNPEALKKLEDITHPVIRQAINALVKRSKQRVVVIEAIKLLESPLKDMVDSVWVVNADLRTQYIRLVKRRKMSEAEAKQRLQAQGPQADKVKAADVVIENNGNVEDTWKQVQLQWQEIKRALTAPPEPPKQEVAKTADSTPTTQEPVQEDTGGDDGIDPIEPKTVDGIAVRRGMPPNAELIARFITERSGVQTSRMDVMMTFGQKSYFVAQNESEAVLGVMGWTVENLVTRMDEFYLDPGVEKGTVVHAMVMAIEEASKELQSEVAFFFLPPDTGDDIVIAYRKDGYQPITLKEIKIPAWREAVEEYLSEQNYQVLWKQLRKDRVLQPI